MSSVFDPDAFLNQSVEGENSTKVIVCPPGEYIAVAESATPRTWQSKDGAKSGVSLDIIWKIEDEGVKQICKRDTVQVKQSLFLDLDGNKLSTKEGENVGLGRLRKAINLNDPSRPFALNMIPGQMAKVVVTHRTSDEDIFAEIKKVLPAQ